MTYLHVVPNIDLQLIPRLRDADQNHPASSAGGFDPLFNESTDAGCVHCHGNSCRKQISNGTIQGDECRVTSINNVGGPNAHGNVESRFDAINSNDRFAACNLRSLWAAIRAVVICRTLDMYLPKALPSPRHPSPRSSPHLRGPLLQGSERRPCRFGTHSREKQIA